MGYRYNPSRRRQAGNIARMLDRTIAPAADSARETASLARRRALYAALTSATMVGLMLLAVVAVPPRGVAAVLFLALFTLTLPWSVVGFWNATIGFLLLTCARDPVAAVNPMAARIRGDETITARTAILMCIRNEAPAQVTRNLRPLLDGLVTGRVAHLFHVYLLSDSSDPEIVAAEEACFRRVRRRVRRRGCDHVPAPRDQHGLQGRQYPRLLRPMGRRPRIRDHLGRRQFHAGRTGAAPGAHHAG